MAKKRHHRRRAHRHRSRARSHRRRNQNPIRYLARRARRRNISFGRFGGFTTNDLLWAGGGALANGVLSRALPQTLLPAYNVGWTGYGLNILAGSVGAWGIGKVFGKRAGQGAWIGMVVAVGQRIIAEKFGAGSAGASAGMSGDLDFDLGYYLSDSFPYAQGPSAGPYANFPGVPYSPMLPTANAAAPGRWRQTAALVAAGGAPGAPAAVGPASAAQTPGAWGGAAWG